MLASPFRLYYSYWSMACLPLAVLAALMTWSFRCAMGEVLFLVWLQFVVYLLHQIEEHFWPGGFKQFINEKVFHSSIMNYPLDDTIVFFINIPIIWILFPLGALAAQHIDLAIGSFLPVFGMVNAITHCIAALVKRCYNPGLVVSLLLNIPTGYYTLKTMLNAGVITHSVIGGMVLVSIVIHVGMVGCIIMRYRSVRS